MNKRKGKRSSLTYQVMNATKMIFEDDTFDVVIDKVRYPFLFYPRRVWMPSTPKTTKSAKRTQPTIWRRTSV